MATTPEPPNADSGSFPRGPHGENEPSGSGDTLLFRRYRVIRELGRGGMGVVLLAHDTALDIPVALKLIPDLVTRDTEAVADLRKEVLRGMALTHAGIVRTHNFERDEGGAGIVMEYVDGDNLTDLKVRQPGGCFDPEQVLPWLEQIAAVLDYAHREAHIVHRDLKPRNIMLTSMRSPALPGSGASEARTDRIKVADFGIAATLSDSVSRHSMEGKVSGTLSYMSPQQAEGKRPTHLDDIHALGATIYELLTGKPPFFRGNPAALMAQIITVVPPSMTERRADLEVTGKAPIPPAWEAVVAACLAKEPEDRPQSAGEMLTRLRAPVESPTADATLRGAPLAAPEVPAPASRRGAFIGAGLLVLAIAAVLFGVFQAKRPVVETATTQPIAQVSPVPVPAPEVAPTPAPSTPQPVAMTPPETPKPAPTPMPLPTELKIIAEPAEATVWSGDKKLGPTPFTLPKTATGEYLVRHDGYFTARIDPASLPATQGELKVPLRAVTADAFVGTWDFLHGPVRTGSELDRRNVGAIRRSITHDEHLVEFAMRDGALAVTRFNLSSTEQYKMKEGNQVRIVVFLKWPGNFSCVVNISPRNNVSVRSEMECPFEVEALQFVPSTGHVAFKTGYSGTITTTITSPQKIKPQTQKQAFYLKQVFALDEFGEKLVDIEEERMGKITPELVRTRIAQHFKTDEFKDIKPTYGLRIASPPTPPAR